MKQIIFLISMIVVYLSTSAQYYSMQNRQKEYKESRHFENYGTPTRHEDFADYYVMGGFQHLNHPIGDYNVATIQAEILFSFFGSRVSLTTGPDYMSFSPCGIFLFAPRVFANTMRGQSSNPALLPFMLIAISASQWHFPLTDHLEVSMGWDALKFTKLKNYDDTYYITGSINAGLTYFIGNHFFVNGYYEYNHTHNPIIGVFNWMFSGEYSSGNQPDVLTGHSYGTRIGYMF